jgi:hypothetical protein
MIGFRKLYSRVVEESSRVLSNDLQPTLVGEVGICCFHTCLAPAFECVGEDS